jgi:hypothetical protein
MVARMRGDPHRHGEIAARGATFPPPPPTRGESDAEEEQMGLAGPDGVGVALTSGGTKRRQVLP